MKIKTISICAKTSDMFSCNFVGEDGSVTNYDGYVPSFFPGEHYGDYVILDIDVKTGVITNWKVPTQKNLKPYLEK